MCSQFPALFTSTIPAMVSPRNTSSETNRSVFAGGVELLGILIPKAAHGLRTFFGEWAPAGDLTVDLGVLHAFYVDSTAHPLLSG